MGSNPPPLAIWTVRPLPAMPARAHPRGGSFKISSACLGPYIGLLRLQPGAGGRAKRSGLQPGHHATSHHRRRPRCRRLSRQGVPRGGPRRRSRGRRRGGAGARARRPIRRADRRPHAAQARRPVHHRDPAQQGHRDAGPDPLGAGPGRRPGQGSARRRRRLPAQALLVLGAAGAHRGAGAPPRRPRGDGLPGRRSRARSAVAPGGRAPPTRSCCSRASSACSNIS